MSDRQRFVRTSRRPNFVPWIGIYCIPDPPIINKICLRLIILVIPSSASRRKSLSFEIFPRTVVLSNWPLYIHTHIILKSCSCSGGGDKTESSIWKLLRVHRKKNGRRQWTVNSLRENGVDELVDKPAGKKIVKSK